MSAGNVCSKAKQEKLGLGYVEDLYLTFLYVFVAEVRI